MNYNLEIIISLFLLLSFFIYILFVIINGTIKKDAVVKCPIGTCPTDITTGEKKCDTLEYIPGLQTCNPIGSCDIGNAISSDASSFLTTCDNDPVTGEVSTCRCLPEYTCPNYVTSIFKTFDGSAYSTSDLGRTSFYQELYDDGKYSAVGLNFCGVPVDFLFRSSPGCDYIPQQTDRATPEENIKSRIILCMRDNPCIEGYAAFVTDDFENFDSNSLERLGVSCVSEQPLISSGNVQGPILKLPCDIDSVPVYDSIYGFTSCVKVR